MGCCSGYAYGPYGILIDPSPGLSGIAVALQGRGKLRRLDGVCYGSLRQAGQNSTMRGCKECGILRVSLRYVTLVLVFAFCQVIGAMCALPDRSVAEGSMLFVEEGMVCPMEGTTMCLPSAMSSPERQLKR